MMSIFKISNTTLYKLKWYIMIPQKTEVIHTIKGIVVQRVCYVSFAQFISHKENDKNKTTMTTLAVL